MQRSLHLEVRGKYPWCDSATDKLAPSSVDIQLYILSIFSAAAQVLLKFAPPSCGQFGPQYAVE
jgi:hypothetical protein